MRQASEGPKGELEHDVAAMTHDSRTDLDQLLAQLRERSMLDLLRQGQHAHEVREVVGERVQLQPNRVVPEGAAGRGDRRVQRIAFFPSLMCCSAVPRPFVKTARNFVRYQSDEIVKRLTC
jgi:hypothetical protein